MKNRPEFGESEELVTSSELENKCVVCGKEKGKVNVKFCSFQCYHIYGRPDVVLKGRKIERICKQCGKSFKVSPSRITGTGGHQGKFCSHKCYWAFGQPHRIGEKRPSCIGDKISKIKSLDKEKCQSPIKLLIRESRKNEQWKYAVFARDKNTCQNCGKKHNVIAHHIKPFSLIIDELIAEKGAKNLYEKAMEYNPLWDIANSITLCIDCHNNIPRYSRRVETKRFAPQIIEDGAIVRTPQGCGESSRNVLTTSCN